jgi:hypothetical protein
MRVAASPETMNRAERIEPEEPRSPSPREPARAHVQLRPRPQDDDRADRLDLPGRSGLAELEGPGARISDLARAIARRIRRRPITSLAAAIGVGFLVGGALSFRAGRVALAAAARHVTREVLKQVL